MQVTIHARSGFCFGVTYAIQHAEKNWKEVVSYIVLAT